MLWYRESDESSAQQIPDVVDILKVKHGQLDTAYLDDWAERLGIADLLARARELSAK